MLLYLLVGSTLQCGAGRDLLYLTKLSMLYCVTTDVLANNCNYDRYTPFSSLLYKLLFTVGLTTATHGSCTHGWLDGQKFTFRNFSLRKTWLLVWCLECAEVNTSPQFLKIYTGCLLVSE